jgi:hypothetical protein
VNQCKHNAAALKYWSAQWRFSGSWPAAISGENNFKSNFRKIQSMLNPSAHPIICSYCQLYSDHTLWCIPCAKAFCPRPTCMQRHDREHDATTTIELTALNVTYEALVHRSIANTVRDNNAAATNTQESNTVIHIIGDMQTGCVISIDPQSIAEAASRTLPCHITFSVPLRPIPAAPGPVRPALTPYAEPQFAADIDQILLERGGGINYRTILHLYADALTAIVDQELQQSIGFSLCPSGLVPSTSFAEHVITFVREVQKAQLQAVAAAVAPAPTAAPAVAPAPTTARVCSVCGAPARTKCGRCRTVRYCSRECQLQAWDQHRHACGE